MPGVGENCSETNESSNTIESLGQGPLALILSFLSIKDICRASLTCRALRDAGRNESVWHAKALERYPQSTLILAPRSSYTDYRSLRLDDNAENSSLIIPFPHGGLSSDYKMNRPDYFFECCITALQYNRSHNNDALQIFFDCRGEVDLRDPLSSSIAFVVHRPRPCRRELREELARLNIQRQELREVVERLEPLLKQDSAEDAAPRHLAALRALHMSSHRLYTLSMELQDCSTIGFSDLVTVLRPSSKENEHHFLINTPGHYKGWIQFNNISQIDELAETDLDSFSNIKKAIEQHGMDLVFTYANPVPVLPQMNQIDYHPVTLLQVPPAATVVETLKTEGKYASYDEFHEKFLINESVEEERERWSHVQREMEAPGRGGRGRRRAPLGSDGGGGDGGGGFNSWFV